MNTKIFVMTHKSFVQPKADIYVPLHVGREGKPDLGYLSDNVGNHISDLNMLYGELTGVYWIWNNYRGDENIGICHYRRFFVDEEGKLLEEQDYNQLLEDYDIITSNAIDEGCSYYDYFSKAHGEKNLLLEGEIIKKIYPEYYDYFQQCMNGHKHYYGNLMVTSRELFNKYCEWLFTIFVEMGEHIDLTGLDEYHRRVYGFLSEQLLMVWIKTNHLKVKEQRVGIFDEKAETKEFKQAIGYLISCGKIEEAISMYLGVLKARPDIMLEHSDLKGEIPIIGKILMILREEKNGNGGIYTDNADDLSKLIQIYKKNEKNI